MASSIVSYVPEQHRDIEEGVYRHLELGGANYGPETECEGPYVPSEKQHVLLYAIFDWVMKNKEPAHKRIDFIINDLKDRDIQIAAENLSNHVREKRYEVDLRIIKIAEDFTKFRMWPQVQSAFLLNPPSSHIRNLVISEGDQYGLYNLVSQSKTGVLFKECINWRFAEEYLWDPSNSEDRIYLKNKMFHEKHLHPKGVEIFAAPKNTHEITYENYYFPNGKKIPFSVSFVLKKGQNCVPVRRSEVAAVEQEREECVAHVEEVHSGSSASGEAETVVAESPKTDPAESELSYISQFAYLGRQIFWRLIRGE